MRKLLLALVVLCGSTSYSQDNVGIGTATPQTKLHVLVPGGPAYIRAETNTPGAVAGLDLKSSSTTYDQLELYKYATAAGGTMAGINLAGLSTVISGASAQGGLLVGVIGNYPLHFTTNNTERMRITEGGLFGIGTSVPDYKFHLRNNGGETGLGIQNDATGGQSILTLGSGARAVGNALSLIKYGSTITGNAYGIPRANLSLITADAGGGSLLMGTATNKSLYMGTNSEVRMEIRGDGNTGIGVDANDYSRLHVRRLVTHFLAPPLVVGAFYAENGSNIDGSGVFGATLASKGAFNYAGVSGNNQDPGTEKFGVIGVSSGTSTGAAYSAGVGGYGDNGVLGSSSSNTGSGVLAQHSSGKTALEVNNGFIKVSGDNKSAFKHITTAGNVSFNLTRLSYANANSTDIIMVTHDYGNMGIYHNKHVGVWWDGTTWTIFNEDSSNMIAGLAFNVLVIKQ